jgi:hypothetical protein
MQLDLAYEEMNGYMADAAKLLHLIVPTVGEEFPIASEKAGDHVSQNKGLLNPNFLEGQQFVAKMLHLDCYVWIQLNPHPGLNTLFFSGGDHVHINFFIFS